MRTFIRKTAIGAVCLLASGAAVAETKNSCPTSNDNPALLPLLSFAEGRGTIPDDKLPPAPAARLHHFVGDQGYTRVKLTFVPCGGARAYSDEHRGWMKRLFAGKAVSKLLTVRVNFPGANAAAVHPIASIGRNSSRKAGETWSTEVSNSIWLTPYFRVKTNDVAKVDFELKAATDYTSSISSDVLDLLKRATTLINPASTLVTSLNKDRFSQAASFTDSTINGFFKQSVAERSTNEFRVGEGSKVIGAVYLSLPGANDTMAAPAPVGVWVVTTDELIGSIFQPSVAGPTLAYDSMSAASVLNYRLTPERTVEQALNEDSGVKLARDNLLKATGTSVAASAYALCQALSSAADRYELTPTDGAAIRWAYPQSLPLDRSGSDPRYSVLVSSCTSGPQPVS